LHIFKKLKFKPSATATVLG